MVTYGDITKEVLADLEADISWLEQAGWEEHYAEFVAGEFAFIGIRAACEIQIPNGDHWIVQRLHSPGLWGIEDSSSEEYLEEVFQEERETLLAMLRELGATARVAA